MKAVTVSTLRKDLKKHLDYVSNSLGILIVPRTKGDDSVVIMSMNEYNSLKETEYLLSTDNNIDRLQESINQMNAGNTIPYDENEDEVQVEA